MTSWSSSAASSPNGISLLFKRLGSKASFPEELLSTNRSDGSKNTLSKECDSCWCFVIGDFTFSQFTNHDSPFTREFTMGVAKYIKNEKDEVQDVILQSGIHVKPLYTNKDLEAIGFDPDKDLALPGEYPYTRGIHSLGYRSREWTTRQYTGFGTPQETNERFKLMISHGQTGLNVAFDLPTQMGYDSDDPMAEGEVGRVGMAVDSLQVLEIVFKDLKLNRIGTGLTINAVASVMLAMYQAMAEKSGYKKEDISATPQNDILKEMVGRGAWIYPVEPAVRLIGDTIEYSMKELPRCNPVSVCGYHIRESGCTPVQEISYAFEIAFAYIDEVVKRGYTAEECVGGFTFN